MFSRLSIKLGVWAAVAVVAAFVINVALVHLHWENTRADEIEAVITIALMVFLYYFARKLVFRPMKEIENMAERIKAGDLDARINITSSRELTVLTETLNSMVEKLADSNRQLQKYSRSLEREVEERTMKLNAERDLRIALLTHDLKSPLTSILGYSELLLSGGRYKLEGEQEEYVESIMRSGERLLDMAEQYLDLTKMEAGLSGVKLAPVDPEMLLKEAVSGLEVQALEKKIALSCDIAPGLPTLLADERKMARVFANLITNAIKYTPEGGAVTVKSYPAALETGEPAWAVTVSDTGYGIADDDIKNIFKTYYRSSSSAGTRGTGLGLAVVKSFVEAHGGTVRVESSKGTGSSFTVLIPVRQAKQEKTEGEAAA